MSAHINTLSWAVGFMDAALRVGIRGSADGQAVRTELRLNYTPTAKVALDTLEFAYGVRVCYRRGEGRSNTYEYIIPVREHVNVAKTLLPLSRNPALVMQLSAILRLRMLVGKARWVEGKPGWHLGPGLKEARAKVKRILTEELRRAKMAPVLPPAKAGVKVMEDSA